MQNVAAHAHEVEVFGQNQTVDVGDAYELERLPRFERPNRTRQCAHRLEVLRQLQLEPQEERPIELANRTPAIDHDARRRDINSSILRAERPALRQDSKVRSGSEADSSIHGEILQLTTIVRQCSSM